MNNPYSTCTEYQLKDGPGHLVKAEDWENVEALLTDLQFIEAKSAAGFAYDLQNDYAMALARWPGYQPWDPFTQPPPEPAPENP